MNRTEHLLIVLSEECAEVTKEVSKALRFGLNDCNPNAILDEALITNAERITKEVADLMGIIEMLVNEGIINQPPIRDIYEKKRRVAKYLKYAESKKTIKTK